MSQVTTPEEYKVLYSLNKQEHKLEHILCDNGAASLAVCPECRVGRFVHTEGCKIGDECEQMMEREIFGTPTD